MVLSPEELKKLQGVCLELVCEVDRVCRKNGIEYTLEGGTMSTSDLGSMSKLKNKQQETTLAQRHEKEAD